MKKKIFIILSILIISLLVLINLSSKEKDISSFLKINYTGTYNQKDEEYLVYFWQKDCESCKEIESDVLDYYKRTKMPIYIVDMGNTINTSVWYDWENHHIKNDKAIGNIVDNQFIFYEGEGRENYVNDGEIDWEVIVNENDEIVAVHNTPLLNEEPKTVNDINIAGTPTIIKVKNGKFDAYAFNIEEVKNLLK